MNLKQRFGQESSLLRLHYKENNLPSLMCQHIMNWFPYQPREYVAVCIGTDRSTGDALGPLAGMYFQTYKPRHIRVYGTIHEPVHAVNLEESLERIYKLHNNPFIIAIDACLGRSTSIGHIITEKKSLQPGTALNKTLPAVGDISITGVVNVSGFMEHSILQNTRLSVVMDMAKQVSAILEDIDDQLTYVRIPTVIQARKEKTNPEII